MARVIIPLTPSLPPFTNLNLLTLNKAITCSSIKQHSVSSRENATQYCNTKLIIFFNLVVYHIALLVERSHNYCLINNETVAAGGESTGIHQSFDQPTKKKTIKYSDLVRV